MNFKRGLFRIWVLLAALFIIATLVFGWSGVHHEFEKQAFRERMQLDGNIPIYCEDAKGEVDKDFQLEPGNYMPNGEEACWYEMAKFRALFPEFKDVTDEKLRAGTYRNVLGKNPVSPWWAISTMAAFAIGWPLALLAFGSAIYWALAGFARSPSVPR